MPMLMYMSQWEAWRITTKLYLAKFSVSTRDACCRYLLGPIQGQCFISQGLFSFTEMEKFTSEQDVNGCK